MAPKVNISTCMVIEYRSEQLLGEGMYTKVIMSGIKDVWVNEQKKIEHDLNCSKKQSNWASSNTLRTSMPWGRKAHFKRGIVLLNSPLGLEIATLHFFASLLPPIPLPYPSLPSFKVMVPMLPPVLLALLQSHGSDFHWLSLHANICLFQRHKQNLLRLYNLTCMHV